MALVFEKLFLDKVFDGFCFGYSMKFDVFDLSGVVTVFVDY